MAFNIQIISIAFLTTLYFILPAYFSNGGALAFGGGTPIDFGKCDSKGNRWIGDGVTWRGLIAGTLIGMITGAIQGYLAPMILNGVEPYLITPIVTNVANGILIGFLLGFGAVIGDALGSFLKRRLRIERGQPAPFLDQLDFIIIAIIFATPLVSVDWIFIIIALILTLIIHLIANGGAYLIGLKDIWY